MVSIVSNPILFLGVKIIGISVIIIMMSKIIAQNIKIASFGMKFLIFMMLFVVGNNLFVITGSAVSVASFSAVSGTVGNGNGYYDDDTLQFNLSSNSNIYAVTESGNITILEPIGYSFGASAAKRDLIQKGDSDLKYGVVGSDGYIYFIDSQGIKRKNTRNSDGSVYANSSVDVGIITSDSPEKIYEYDSRMYYIISGTLKSFSILSSYTVQTDFGGLTGDYSLSVYERNGVLTVFHVYMSCVGNYGTVRLYMSNGTSKNNLVIPEYSISSGAGCAFTSRGSSTFITERYLFYQSSGQVTVTSVTGYNESVIHLSNLTLFQSNYVYSGLNYHPNSYDLGGYTTVGLYSSTNIYTTFGFFEAGTLNSLGNPIELEYSNSYIQSVYTTYYNNSNIDIQYNLNFVAHTGDFDIPLFGTNTLLFSHSANMLYNGTLLNSHPIGGSCTNIGALAILLYGQNAVSNCTASGSYSLSSVTGWAPGTYSLQLIEQNSTSGVQAIVDEDTYIVLNQSGTLVGTVPYSPSITSGTAPATLALFDGFVSLLGWGVNPVSKFAFALIVIALCMLTGFIATKGQIFGGVIIGLIPYLFFTFIEYVPAWGIVILGIVVAIKIGFFR